MIGQRHLVECHCIMAQYSDKVPAVYHRFLVYNKLDERGIFVKKYVNCNNCALTHFVFDTCKSDVHFEKEDVNVLSIDDIKVNIPEKISEILDNHDCDITIYELVEDVLEGKYFPHDVILSREIISDEHHIKLLKISGKDKVRITTEVIRTLVKEQWMK